MPMPEAATWWARARDRGRGGHPDALELMAWNNLPWEAREEVENRVKEALAHEDPRVRELGFHIAEDIVCAEWGEGSPSEHLRLEIATAQRRGHTPRPMPRSDDLQWMMEGMDHETRQKVLNCYASDPPMNPGEPIPGCSCPDCTGVRLDDPARPKPRWMWAPSTTTPRPYQVEQARSRPLLEVARSLGMDPRKAGREWVVSCPFHKDKTPSLYLNPEKGLWKCFGCGRGGDGISLAMEVKKAGFNEAVRELAG